MHLANKNFCMLEKLFVPFFLFGNFSRQIKMSHKHMEGFSRKVFSLCCGGHVISCCSFLFLGLVGKETGPTLGQNDWCACSGRQAVCMCVVGVAAAVSSASLCPIPMCHLKKDLHRLTRTSAQSVQAWSGVEAGPETCRAALNLAPSLPQSVTWTSVTGLGAFQSEPHLTAAHCLQQES